MPKFEKRKCLIGGCSTKGIYAGGICHSHYSLIRRLIKQKKRTWEEFERVGMALKPKLGRNGYYKI